ncbi:MAG: response regulator [Desulfobacterales bacterium]|nr:MAG: response regulator [Desulfobacterales bacterium]
MSVISVFSGTFSKTDPVVQEVLSQRGGKLINDQEVVSGASALSGISSPKLSRAFTSKTSVFNKFTHEKECSVAYLKLALAEMLTGDHLLIAGFTSQLIPSTISHVLRVCLIAELKYRIEAAIVQHKISEKEAAKLIAKQDEDCVVWVTSLLGADDPWNASLYDIVVPMHKTSVTEAAQLITAYAAKEVVQPTARSQQAVADFHLAAQTEVALVREGHNVDVSAEDGAVTLTINKHVLMLSRLEEELKSVAGKVAGVRSVATRVGKGYYQADIYRKYDFERPSKVLLVDDEREFAQTLSERLLMRDMGSTVAYDGESALNMIQEDEPEVMILDLKMPGIDGIEVLRRVKATRPEIEVIILTGHGSEADRETCMQLGAFAYLQKPVDIGVLTETLKKANEKMRQNLAAKA